jgi:hypothetical protein
MSATRSKTPFKYNYILKGHTIEPVETTKYLGIAISSKVKVNYIQMWFLDVEMLFENIYWDLSRILSSVVHCTAATGRRFRCDIVLGKKAQKGERERACNSTLPNVTLCLPHDQKHLSNTTTS